MKPVKDVTKLEVGDVVCLKSGGPEMTVSSVGTDGHSVEACWFAKNCLRAQFFSPAALERLRAQ